MPRRPTAAVEVREEELAQEAQETGPEGSRILGERGAEVQEWGRLIMAALEKRDPGQLEKRRAANGVWYTAACSMPLRVVGRLNLIYARFRVLNSVSAK